MYSEFDCMVRKEQMRDYVREAEHHTLVKEAGHGETTSISKALLVLPMLLISLGSRLLTFSMHTGRNTL